MKERELIGKGFEHHVYVSSSNPNLVLKTPRRRVSMTLKTVFGGVEKIHSEMSYAKELTANSPLQIPKTRIFAIRDGYIMAQERIFEDQSVDIEKVLSNYPILLNRYQSSPSNFATQNGSAFWLDPTRGITGRFVEKIGIDDEKIRTIELGAKKAFRKIKEAI